MAMRNKAIARIIAMVCILIAGFIVIYIVSFLTGKQSEHFILSDGQGARFDFIIDSADGFVRETPIYTENGITGIAFTGKLTVDGTAEISIISDQDGHVVFSQAYTDLDAQAIALEITGLLPYSYYTLRFYSDSAKSANLAFTTNQSLVKRPERPEKPTPAIPLNLTEDIPVAIKNKRSIGDGLD